MEYYTRKKLNNNDEVYSVLTGSMDTSQIEKKKGEFINVSTLSLIQQGSLSSCLELPANLHLRYDVAYTAYSELEKQINVSKDKAVNHCNHIYAIATFARTSEESANIAKKIQDLFAKEPQNQLVFVDYSQNTMPDEKFNDWVNDKATSAYYQDKDNDQAEEYAGYANGILSEWRNDIKNGSCVLYDATHSTGLYISTSDMLMEELLNIDFKRFRYGLEHFTVTDTMWLPLMMKQGVEYGVTEDVKGAYRSSNPNTKLENALSKAWKIDNYWEKSPADIISKIKVHIDDFINHALNANGRISISDIYNDLKQPPFGFLPCNLTAFIIGFLMKEYVIQGNLSWSDDMQSTDLSIDKLKEMVDEVIKLDITPNKRYKDKYIVAMTPEEKAFNNTTSVAFRIGKNECTSLEATRLHIRYNMVSLMFPVWSLLYYMDSDEGKNLLSTLSTPIDILKETIKLYYDIANNDISQSGKSDNDIANAIGKLSLRNKNLDKDLKEIVTSDHCKLGMLRYLDDYKEGELPLLANRIKDGGQYINAVKNKFDAESANWVWKKVTADEKIDEVITEYGIAAATTDWLSQTCKSYGEAIMTIKERCNAIRVPFVMIKNDLGDLGHFMELLYHLVKDGTVQESSKAILRDDIKTYGNAFNDFQNKQIEYFKKGCSSYLDGLTDSDVTSLFTNLPFGSFTMDLPEYIQSLEKTITDFKQKQGSVKMKNLWVEKTGTKSPFEWSKKYCMPIKYMLDENEYNEGSKVFATINNPNSDAKSVDMALRYLENAPEKFWINLNSAQNRDDKFRKMLLGDKSVLLSDIQKVKNYLIDMTTTEPYYWDQPAVRNAIDKLAQKAYVDFGYKSAFSKIDSMDAEDVKKYLKSLIKNNMNVGIEIIKEN